MHITRHNKITKQYGFSLWELSIVMLILIGLFIALVKIMPYIVQRENVEFDQSIVIKVDEQISGFIATYSRLPCPDSDNDGEENCSSNSGTIPYKTLGLNEDYAGVGSIPINYAVFRNAGIDADLTNITDFFNPTDSHGTVTTLNQINGLDFCTALANANASAFSTSFAHIVLPDGAMIAVPYVIVTAGMGDADGSGSAFDGLNDTAALNFEAPNKNHNATYDDTVFSKSFAELASALECDTAQNSLNLLADAKATHTENVTQAQNIQEAAELAIIITIMQTALGIANTAMAVYNLVLAGILVGVASASLASAIATCVASLGTACALVGLAIAGLVAAIAAVISAGVSVGLNIAALVVQTIAIVRTIDVANRAGSTVSVPNPNTSTNTTGPIVNNSDLAAQARATAETLKQDAANKVIAARNSINDARGLSVTVRNRFNLLKSETQALANTNAAVSDTLFSSYTNSANSQTQININQANSAITNLASAHTNAINAVSALGAPTLAGNYPNADFPLVATRLGLAEPQMTTAQNSFTNLSNSYLSTRLSAINARNRIIAIRNALPPLPNNATVAQTNARNAYLAVLQNAQNRAQAVINRVDEIFSNPFAPNFGDNIFSTWIGRELGFINAAQGNTTDALETIIGALDAEASATQLENNTGGTNPAPTTTVLPLSLGVDAILQAADDKGVMK
ncbi:MAG: hypothetical protein L3J83_00285 [Proteobacteria bacterium]|nr:hypothetical protein [Pseudomonadota bacterium]